MASILPTPAQTRQLIANYLADGKSTTLKCLAVANSSPSFREIYRISLATHTVLGNLSSQSMRPSLNPARNVSVRIPSLVSVGQPVVAQAELRRFVELIFWAVYFTDHSVEWQTFIKKTAAGFSRDQRKPIAYAANRELAFYLDYALELMEREPSGLGVEAVQGAKEAVRTLNAAVHAGQLAAASGRLPPHDDVSEPALRRFARIQRSTFSSCTLLLAAYRRSKFDRLNAVSRAHFDWLVGSRLRREVRRGPFGLA